MYFWEITPLRSYHWVVQIWALLLSAVCAPILLFTVAYFLLSVLNACLQIVSSWLPNLVFGGWAVWSLRIIIGGLASPRRRREAAHFFPVYYATPAIVMLLALQNGMFNKFATFEGSLSTLSLYKYFGYNLLNAITLNGLDILDWKLSDFRAVDSEARIIVVLVNALLVYSLVAAGKSIGRAYVFKPTNFTGTLAELLHAHTDVDHGFVRVAGAVQRTDESVSVNIHYVHQAFALELESRS